MSKANRMTLDEALRPMQMECGRCAGLMTMYPSFVPEGTGYCPKCSPPWMQSFAIWGMNQERQRHGLSVMV